MKRRILMLGVVAMLSMPLSVVARNHNQEIDSGATEQITGENSSAKEKDDATVANGQSDEEKPETSGNEKVAADVNAEGDSEAKDGIALEWKDVAIIALVLALAALGYCVVKLRKELATVEDEVGWLMERNGKLQKNNKLLAEQIKLTEDRLRECESAIAQMEERIERERREKKMQERMVVEMQEDKVAFKVLYGKFVESQNGVAARFLSEVKEPSANIMLMLRSENMAAYRLVDGIQADVFSGAVSACDVLNGDLMDFSAINTVEEGIMMLSDGVWSITKRTRIELLK